jgi:serine/threonine protein kinase
MTESYSLSPGASSCANCGAVYIGVQDVCARCGSNLNAQSRALAIGNVLDAKYEILSLIGVGGMGEVYKANHIHLDAFRCIKVMKRDLLSDASFRNRFLREARIATQIQHSNVAVMHDFSTLTDGSYYMVWEFIDGITVRQWGAENGRFPLEIALEIVLQVLAGLDYCHRRGLLHRDISPDNIMIANDADDLLVKIIDLGIAKSTTTMAGTKHTETQVGLFVGNPKYSSPEQLGELEEGEELDGRADLYSLGVVLYEMLLGVPLFKSRTPQGYVVKHLMQAPTPIREVDPSLDTYDDIERVLFKVLAKDRSERYANARELAQAVRRCLAAHTGGDASEDAPHKVARETLALGPRPTVAVPMADVEGTVVKPIVRVATPDQKDWDRAASVDTLEAYRTFLSRHPDSPRAAQATARLNQLLVDQIQQFEDSGDVSSIEAMISTHEEGTRVGDAARAAHLRLLDVIARREGEQNDWAAAVEQDTAAGWREFLRGHPGSARTSDAELALAEAVAFERAGAQGHLAGWREFLKKWPSGAHAAPAMQAIRDLETRLEEAELRAALASESTTGVQRFLAAHPQSPFRAEAERAIRERAEFAVAAADDREEQWAAFLARWPTGVTTARARGLLEARTRERLDLEAATKAGTAAAFQAFLEKHRDGKLRETAGAHLREALAFERAGNDGIAGWNHFLESYPDGLHHAAAVSARQHAIDQFELDRARRDDTPQAWRQFLGKKPADAAIRQQGERRLAELEDAAFRLVVEMRSDERLQSFAETFPDSSRIGELRRLSAERHRQEAQAAAVDAFLRGPASAAASVPFGEIEETRFAKLLDEAESNRFLEHLDAIAKRAPKARSKAAALAAKRVRKRLDDAAAEARAAWNKAYAAATPAAWHTLLQQQRDHPRADEARRLIVQAQAFETVAAADSIEALSDFLESGALEPYRGRAEARIAELRAADSRAAQARAAAEAKAAKAKAAEVKAARGQAEAEAKAEAQARAAAEGRAAEARAAAAAKELRTATPSAETKPAPDANQIQTQILRRGPASVPGQRHVPAPPDAQGDVTVPDVSSPPAVRPLVIISITAAAVILIALAIVLTRPRAGPETRTTTAPEPVTTTTTAPAVAARSPLVIDAHPWGEIVSIRSADGEEMRPAGGGKLYTPASILVPPGRYTVTLSNPSDQKPQVLTATVSSSGGSVEARFTPVDVVEYFKQAGWK